MKRYIYTAVHIIRQILDFGVNIVIKIVCKFKSVHFL
jgi:hypothetical protein